MNPALPVGRIYAAPAPSSGNTFSLEQRWSRLPDHKKQQLMESRTLKTLLNDIEFFKSRRFSAETTVHFMMGMIPQLYNNDGIAVNPPDHQDTILLKDLIRTNRFGFYWSKETSQKTWDKLEKLRDLINSQAGLRPQPNRIPAANSEPISIKSLVKTFYEGGSESHAPLIRNLTTYLTEENSRPFFSLLARQVETADYKGTQKKKVCIRVQKLIESITINKEFRKTMFNCAERQTNTCGDSVTLALNAFDEEKLVWEATSGKLSAQEVYAAGRSLWRNAKLTEIATNTCVQKGIDDQIEVLLGYQVALAKDLKLPGQTEQMLFYSHINPDDVNTAKATIISSEEAGELEAYYLQWPPVMALLEKEHEAEFKELQAFYHKKMEEAENANATSDAVKLNKMNGVAEDYKKAKRDLTESLLKNEISKWQAK